MSVISVRLPDVIKDRLNALAKKTGHKKSFYIQRAILEHLEDMEDLYDAEETWSDIKKGKIKLISSEEFWQDVEN